VTRNKYVKTVWRSKLMDNIPATLNCPTCGEATPVRPFGIRCNEYTCKACGQEWVRIDPEKERLEKLYAGLHELPGHRAAVPQHPLELECPNCGSEDKFNMQLLDRVRFMCRSCGYQWDASPLPGIEDIVAADLYSEAERYELFGKDRHVEPLRHCEQCTRDLPPDQFDEAMLNVKIRPGARYTMKARKNLCNDCNRLNAMSTHWWNVLRHAKVAWVYQGTVTSPLDGTGILTKHQMFVIDALNTCADLYREMYSEGGIPHGAFAKELLLNGGKEKARIDFRPLEALNGIKSRWYQYYAQL
jgi:transposase-like protein